MFLYVFMSLMLTRAGPSTDGGGAGPPGSESGLLLESPADSFLLLENGDFLLLEQPVADTKTSALTALAAADFASADLLFIVDIAPTPTSKKTTLGEFGANPTGTIGLTAVNGTALTFIRSDGAPALSTSVAWQPGQSGGQTLRGDTASGGNLTLMSTFHATKGKILFGTSAYDEVNNRLGIGTASPQAKLHVKPATDVNLWIYESSGEAFLATFTDSGLAYTPLKVYSTNLYLNPDGGPVGIGKSSGLGSKLHISTVTAGSIGEILQASASQSANILEVHSSASALLSCVTPAGWLQNTPGVSRVNGDITNVTITPAAVTGLTAAVKAGRKYAGRLVLFVSSATAADGVRVDFDGGDATMTSFRAMGTVSDTLGTRPLAMTTAVATDFVDTLTTGDSVVTIEFAFVVNAAGTFIPRQAKEADAAGAALTVYANSFMMIEDMP